VGVAGVAAGVSASSTSTAVAKMLGEYESTVRNTYLAVDSIAELVTLAGTERVFRHKSTLEECH
jgi:hypothetical protein